MARGALSAAALLRPRPHPGVRVGVRLQCRFAAYGVRETVDELDAAARRGVRIDLVLEGDTKAGEAFTRLARKAVFWQWPAEHRGAGGRASLHAKLIAADRSSALIGSANLTDRALRDNIELGVILRSPETVDRIVRHFGSLMRPEGPLVRIPPSR